MDKRKQIEELIKSKNTNSALSKLLETVQTVKGDKGDKGEPGYTPLKGKDYFTESEINTMVGYIQSHIKDGKDGKDGKSVRGPEGYTPIRGLDYWTPKDQEKIIKEAISKIPAPKDGVSPDIKEVVKKVQDSMPPVNFKDEVGKILASPGFRMLMHGGGLTTVAVDGTTITGDGTLGNPLIAHSSTAGTWGSITGTLSNQTDLQTALNAKQNTITTGTTAQYLRGDLSLATFPTNVSTFTNDAGYLTSSSLTGYIPYTGGTSNVDLGVHNLTVDTNSLFVDSVNHRVGVGTITPGQALDVRGNIEVGSYNVSSLTPRQLVFGEYQSSGATRPAFIFNGPAQFMGIGQADLTTNTLRIGTTTGVNAAFNTFGTTPVNLIIDGNVGIGTATPGAKLDIADTTLAGSGSLSGSILNLAQTWNTTGNPTAIKLNVTNTASGTSSNLMDLQVGGVSSFKVAPTLTTIGSGSGGGLITSAAVVSGFSSQTTSKDLVFSNAYGYSLLLKGGITAPAYINSTNAGITFPSSGVTLQAQTGQSIITGAYNSDTIIAPARNDSGNLGDVVIQVAGSEKARFNGSSFVYKQGTTGVGTVSNTAGGTTVTGVSTQFTNTFKVGDTITIGGQTVAISAIASNTSMTTAAITAANTGVAYTLVGGTRLAVLGNGNVGIGTTTPGANLDVNGTLATKNNVGILGYTSSGTLTTLARISSSNNSEYFSIGNTIFYNSSLPTMTILNGGNVGIGTTTPTAYLNIKAGTATAGTAPLKFTSGVNLTTPEAGAVEFDGTHFYGTIGSTRYQLDQQSGSGTVTSVGMSVPTGLTVSGSPITTSGTLAVTLSAGYVIPLQTTLNGFVTTDQTVGQTIGLTGARLTKLWATDLDVTNTITGSITGNAGTVTNGVYTTDVTTTPTVSKIVKRDANGNIFANNVFENFTSTVSASGTTVLTVASSFEQVLTGSLSQTFQLPDATTLPLGATFTFNNNSSGSLIVTNNGTSTIYTVPAGGEITTSCTANGTTNGSWDIHPRAPGTVTWGSGITGLVFNTALTTTPMINAGISSATSPSFIPQRGSSTTGFGGDSTHLYGIIGGATEFSLTSSALDLGTSSLTLTGSIGATGARVTKGWFTDGEFTNMPTVGGTSLSSTFSPIVGSASITTLGTIGTGVWNGTAIADTYIASASTWNALPTATSTTTFTNKRVTKRVYSTTDSATATINSDSYDEYYLTAIANNTTISVTGTPTTGQTIFIGLKDAGTSETLTWTGITALGVTLPTATVAGKQHIIQLKYISSTWYAIAVNVQA